LCMLCNSRRFGLLLVLLVVLVVLVLLV